MFRKQNHVPYQQQTPTPRLIPFEFPDDLSAQWHPTEPEFAAMANGASLTMPYLEPFLIRTMREAVELLEDSDAKEHGRAFNTQEQYHYQAHRRFNDLLKSKRYPELEEIEADMKANYKKLSQRSLRTRMAYTAGFESMTLGITKWLIENRVKLFSGADSRVASFMLWHMVEETEHKCVAFDVYTSLYSKGLGNYLARALGVFHGSLDVIRFSMRGYKAILKHDGLWKSPRSRWRLAKKLSHFMWYAAPFLLRSTLPGHNPRQENDPQWVLDWLAGHEQAGSDVIPLVDTQDPDMPVPYPTTVATQAA